MKKNREPKEPKEMELVGGGLNPDEMKRLWGARCVCSTGSTDTNIDPGIGCQCDGGNTNLFSNFAKAI
ncbi:MAG: hypothetical protein KAW12_00740 [Candidatus Aminicenantes bacterium]|nr:hypothetical protein [Candidatus Aminicenantes bacterium]